MKLFEIGSTLSFLSIFLFALPVHAETNDIVVSEIAAYESNGCEWIEIHNTGSESVNLEGWRFWEQDTNHRLRISSSSVQSDWNIDPGEYAIIAQNHVKLFSGACGDYTPPAGTVFDSSWGSLKESGELIGLKDAQGVMVEEFTYIAAPNASLERIDLNLSDYTSANWKEHGEKHTFGAANSTPAEDAVTDPPPPPEAPSVGGPTIRLVVRHEDRFVFDDLLPLPTSTLFSFTDAVSATTSATTTYASSVLAALLTADATSIAFAVSDLVYYENFGSFLVNCIDIASSTPVNACYNWNYVVNGNYPQVGMDQYLLTGDETIYVYFSAPWRLTTPTSTMETDASVMFETLAYKYDNTAEPWAHDPNTMVQIAVPNPAPTGWWDATIPLAAITSDAFGIATTTFTATGTYYASIASADFSKWSYPITLTVIEPSVASTTTSTTETTPPTPPPDTSGGGGGGSTIQESDPAFNLTAAIGFLASQQNADGSIGNGFYADWTAIAFGAHPGTSAAEDALRAYLLTNPSPGTLATDAERRAMALMALGVNPYNGTATNYIQAILDRFADGQFGDAGLFNDDIFAFFPLLGAGISTADPRVASSTAFILSFQEPNGSWGGVDITAAAVQALSLVQHMSGVSDALARARSYLQNQQSADGGFGNDPFATSWAMQALTALGVDTNDDYLASKQSQNGSVSTTPDTTNNRIWATSYAIPAALGKPWGDILASFAPPAQTENLQTATQNSNTGSTIDAGGFTIPPQLEELATSTTSTPSIAQPPPATFTPEIAPDQASALTPSPKPPAQFPQPAPPAPSVQLPETESNLSLPTTTEEAATVNTSTQKTARNIFNGSAALTTLLGLYLFISFIDSSRR